MRDQSLKLSTSQFARLHNLNKRTLHYYDEIGLFSPKYREENKYRYYELSQSIELENILMLKELGMGIEEIKKYLSKPDSEKFIKIADTKLGEIEERIKRLKTAKKVLEYKRGAVVFVCEYCEWAD